jgi:hypothetical protein
LSYQLLLSTTKVCQTDLATSPALVGALWKENMPKHNSTEEETNRFSSALPEGLFSKGPAAIFREVQSVVWMGSLQKSED